MANSYPKDDASQYESGEEWEIGLGNLIIDLDADLEKETMNTNNSLNDSSPFRIGKMKIKRKISANAKMDGSDDTIETLTVTEEKNTKSRKRDIGNSKTDRTGTNVNLCENNIEDDKPKNKIGKEKQDNTEIESKEDATKKDDKNEGKKKNKEWNEKRPRKSKLDKQPSFENVGVGTSDVGTLTEPDKLGPCEPGTSVNLEGIVWHETAEGVLVVNVTWRNKTYVGTLMDCTKHDWAPPRFCESPVNDIEGKAQTSKGRPKRNRNSTSVTDLSNYTETRSSIHCKLRNSTNGKGRRGSNIPVPPVTNTEKTLNGKRKAKTSESELNACDDKAAKKIKNSKTPSPVSSNESTSTPYTTSQVLIECPEPNCNKKYKHINGLRYHQAHAHHELPKKPQEPVDTLDSEDNFNDFTDMDTKDLETVNTKLTDTENCEETPVKMNTEKELDADHICNDDSNETDNVENRLSKEDGVVENDIINNKKENIPEINKVSKSPENTVKESVNSAEVLVQNDADDKLSKSKHPKDLSVFDFNSTTEPDEQTDNKHSEKTSVSVIKTTVESNTTTKDISQPDLAKIETNNVSPVKPILTTGDQQKQKKIEKDKLKLQEKQKKTKPEKVLIKPKPNRPIAPAPQITPQLITFPAVVTAPANVGAGIAIPPTTTISQPIMGSSTLKPIQPKPTVMSDHAVNPVLANLKDKKPKSKKRIKDKEREVDKKISSPSIKEPERKSLVGKTEIVIRPNTGTVVSNLKGTSQNLLEANILKEALSQSGINLDDYNSNSPSGSESNDNKELPRTQTSQPADAATVVNSNSTIPEPPKLIRTSSLPPKQQSSISQRPQPKPLEQFEKDPAEKPVMSVLPAVKVTTVRPQEDVAPRVIIPPPLSSSPDQNRATQSPAYSDISDANEEDTVPRDRIVDVKDPFVFKELGPMGSHSHGRDGVLTEQRPFYPSYPGVIVRDRSHSPLSDVPTRPEMPKLIPKQRIERDIDIEENSDSKSKDESTATKPLYQHPQLYTPHRFPPFYFGYPNHIDPAGAPLHMIPNAPYGHPHERLEKGQRDVPKTLTSKEPRSSTHANVEPVKASQTEINRTDKKIKVERTSDDIRDKQCEGVELKPQMKIRSPLEQSRHYDRLGGYYMYAHPQWEESRRRELEERRKLVKSKPGERKHSSSRADQSPNSRGREEVKRVRTPESASSSTSSVDSKNIRSNLQQDKPHKMEGPYSQYLQPPYMLPYSVVDEQYRQSMVAYPAQYLPPEFSYSPVWKPDKGSNDPKRPKHMSSHSSTSPGKITEILPEGKNALDVLKQHASQLMYPQNKEHLRGQDPNRTSPHKTASPTPRKTPENASIEEHSRFEASRHSPRPHPHPQMQHLHMHHHTHLGYPMMPYGQIIAGNHQQAPTTINPYTNTRE
ncbi:uncharacterized protein [Antedon mediterranea]|uniref:uncharacterized protein n=1 Tax=Antedon mediterranea TaxID=105859 RepID=UPI003AF7270B